MKKIYSKPIIAAHSVGSLPLLAGSGDGVQNSGKGIGYGGVDTGGTKDPSAKADIWQAEYGSWEE